MHFQLGSFFEAKCNHKMIYLGQPFLALIVLLILSGEEELNTCVHISSEYE